MRNIFEKIWEDPFQLMLVALAISMIVMMFSPHESRDEKRVRLYKECMEVKHANEQVCKELVGIETKSNNR